MAMKVELKGKKLCIEIDMEDPPKLSASGKSYVVASTRGNVETEAEYEGHSITIGLNAYYSSRD
jgi:hypothetical protein